jgi:GT2 family glycosyltransferase
MTGAPLVYVIVVNYNGVKYLKTCLSSIEKQTYQNFETIVVDNASADNSAEFIRQHFSKITLLQAEKNLGFAEGNNLAIKLALEEKADYVFLVNNDTELEWDLVEKLVSTAERDDSIGIVGPAVFDLKTKRSLQEMGMAIDKFGYPLALKSPLDKDCVFFVSGCAIMIKSDVLLNVGYFDESYFMFAEDFDLCWRAQLAGYKIVVNEKTRIYHASGGSISGGVVKSSSYETNVKRIFFREKNTLSTLIKNYDTANLTRVVPFYVVLLLFESIFWSSILKPNTSKNILKAIFWNIENLPCTLHKRVLVQKMRKIRDKEILERMLRGYCKLNIFHTIGIPHVIDSQK